VSDPTHSGPTRREAIKTSGTIAVASALAGMTLPNVYAGESNTIQVALVGCGGRGTGAAGNALSTKSGSLKLVAMADVFHDRLNSSLKNLKDTFPAQVDVPVERQFIGFDAYKQAMNCLKKGDVAIFATPPAFRWVHFSYAIEKGLNVFMEKPVTVDGPSSKRMFQLAEEAEKRNLKVGVGLMCRHCRVRGELYDRIKQGQIGDIVLLRAYRQHGIVGSAFSERKPYQSLSELLFQIKRFHSFLWASGGLFSDFYIHNIDECCWMKDAWPVQAKASGGRHYRGNAIDQNFDSYSVEYTFADGAKLFLEGRTMPGCTSEFASFAHGSKGSAVVSSNSHTPARSRIYKGQHLGSKEHLVWSWPQKDEPDPYKLEWDDLIEAIRKDKPYNEARRGTEASLVTCMGRMAAHTGQVITRDQMLKCDHEFAPDVDKLTLEGPAPLACGDDGKYPVPQPGIKTKREY
jgi:predicted dehydrogenase